jgi:hypothetical protein
MVDLAKLIDSLHRTIRAVAGAPAADQTGLSQEVADRITSMIRDWFVACVSSMREAYAEVAGTRFLPDDQVELERLLRAYRLDLAFESLLAALEEHRDDEVESSVLICADILNTAGEK